MFVKTGYLFLKKFFWKKKIKTLKLLAQIFCRTTPHNNDLKYILITVFYRV